MKEIQFFKAKLLQAEEYINALQKQNQDMRLLISSLRENVSSLSSEIGNLNDQHVTEVANLNDQIVKSDRNSIQLLSEIQQKSY